MRRHLLIAILLLAALLAPAQTTSANTAAGKPVFLEATGHTLAYSFRIFWDRYGGLPIFGYPITEVFVENGRPVQYFERARLEWHGDKALVLAGLLGRWAAEKAYPGHPSFAPATPLEGRDFYPQTNHNLGGAFGHYWRVNGALFVFGYPISEEFYERDPQTGQEYIVQYFERARFEYHPNNPDAHKILLGHLGRQYLEAEWPAPDWALARVSGPEHAWQGLRPTRIRMPRIGIDTEVVEGGFSLGAWDVPRYTAIHYWPISGFPGTPGNISIAGHVGYRDTIFNHLPQATVGDEVILSMGQAERRYRVTAIWTVLPEDSWVMAPTSDEVLTLITCVPPGTYTHRLIVRAEPIEP